PPCHFLSFFFQAEDGIRDFHVTGVQTCALPISLRFRPRRSCIIQVDHLGSPLCNLFSIIPVHAKPPNAHSCSGASIRKQPIPLRSEERRVGKECSARRSPRPKKKNTRS